MLRRDRQSGQVLIAFAISFALLLFGLFSVVGDLSEMYASQVTAQQAAVAAAISGAAQVDVYSGMVRKQVVLAPNFASACKAVGDSFTKQSGSTQCDEADVNGVQATVTIAVPAAIVIPGFGPVFHVKATYRAASVPGGTAPAPGYANATGDRGVTGTELASMRFALEGG